CIDVLIHNAGHMVFGPAEAFTPNQLAELYDINVLSTQRVNRAVLPHLGYGKKIQEAFAAIVPPDADAGKVAEAIVAIVDAPFGKRPFRVHVDPTQDGADVAFTVMDRVRAEMLHRVGLPELLSPVKAS
ncbi:MAG TPA: SDR family NAD(P)-dependent oxidoreductase, partial [Bryobacteraceae bacterium]|nr:SDR family NAD(P)-dependent oxidoreductase [Bryobacteraceae bacterium]